MDKVEVLVLQNLCLTYHCVFTQLGDLVGALRVVRSSMSSTLSCLKYSSLLHSWCLSFLGYLFAKFHTPYYMSKQNIWESEL